MYHTFIFKELSLYCMYISVAVYSLPSDVTNYHHIIIQIKTPDVTNVSGMNEKTAAVAEVTMSEGPDVQSSIHVDS